MEGGLLLEGGHGRRPRILFLHGYGLCPELTETAGYLNGLRAALPGCIIDVPGGFHTLDLDEPVVQNIFNDPVNGLKSVARYSKATGTACRAWAQQRALTAEELLPDAPPVPLAGPGAARESIDEMRAGGLCRCM